MKKKTKIIIGILIAAVIVAAGITWYVMNQKNQKTGNSSAEVVAWDVDIEEEEPSEEKGILIPGYTSMVMKANTKEQTVSIGNPADNDCIFVIVLKLEDGTKLFESQPVFFIESLWLQALRATIHANRIGQCFYKNAEIL